MTLLPYVIIALGIVALNGLAIASLLHWMFRGEVRHFLFANIFPADWLNGLPPERVLAMTTPEFDTFLNAESDAPLFFRGLFSCPGCMSAHLSYVVMLPVLIAFLLSSPSVALACLLIPAWAGSAFLGRALFQKF